MTLFIQEVNFWIWSRPVAPETDALAWPHKSPLDTGWRHGSCDEMPLFPERGYWVMWASTWISGSQGEGLEGVCALWPSWTLWACSNFAWAALEKVGITGHPLPSGAFLNHYASQCSRPRMLCELKNYSGLASPWASEAICRTLCSLKMWGSFQGCT